MAVLIEPLILYLVLFLPGAIPQELPEFIPFSIYQELNRILIYDIPSLALIWYLVLRAKSFRDWGMVRPRFHDFLSFIIALPGILLTSFCISALSSVFDGIIAGIPVSSPVETPHGLVQWLIMAVSCMSTGYLEESYFRYYLVQRLEDAGIGQGRRIFLSCLFFSLCHLYEGPWGVLNAALAGMLLSLVFMRQKSLHGIAWAHGAYNAFVYTESLLKCW
ncbi:MAG: CPBP family intramembrane metalloprotease [Treponema sp.]|jgi:membrane protease YdiL (CAAX protease family)|nr:CPBP family intramembrane metalloprotease [Treponema sp.]